MMVSDRIWRCSVIDKKFFVVVEPKSIVFINTLLRNILLFTTLFSTFNL